VIRATYFDESGRKVTEAEETAEDHASLFADGIKLRIVQTVRQVTEGEVRCAERGIRKRPVNLAMHSFDTGS
jgi:hypothetical protein